MIHSLKWKGLSEVWWLNRERNAPGASVTLSPNPELLQTEKQGSEPLLPLIAPSALFSIVFLSLHFSFIFSPFFSFSPFFFFLFPSFFPQLPHFFSFLFPFLLSFLFLSLFQTRCEVLRSEPGEKVLIWSRIHHLCCNIWYLGPISKISRSSRPLPLNVDPSIWDYQPHFSHTVWTPGFASSAHSEDTTNFCVLHRLTEEWKQREVGSK